MDTVILQQKPSHLFALSRRNCILESHSPSTLPACGCPKISEPFQGMSSICILCLHHGNLLIRLHIPLVRDAAH